MIEHGNCEQNITLYASNNQKIYSHKFLNYFFLHTTLNFFLCLWNTVWYIIIVALSLIPLFSLLQGFFFEILVLKGLY